MAAEITIASGNLSPQLVNESPRLLTTPPSSVLQKSPRMFNNGRGPEGPVTKVSLAERRLSDFQRQMAENSPFGGPGFYQTAMVGFQGLQDDPAKENRTPIMFKSQATGNGFGRSNWTKQANSNPVASEGNLSLTELQARLRDKELQVTAMQAELVRCMKVKLEAEVKLQEHLHQVSLRIRDA